MLQILFVESDHRQAPLIERMLQRGLPSEFVFTSADTLAQAFSYLGQTRFDLILLDLTLIGTGLQVFIEIRNSFPEIPVVIIVEPKNEATALEAIALGAQEYVVKGEMNSTLLKRAIHCALKRQRYLADLQSQRNTAMRALDHLTCGVILIDQRRRILRVNRCARQILDQNDGLVLRKNALETSYKEETTLLRRKIREALREKGSYLTITRRSMQRPLSILITRLNMETFDSGDRKATAAVFITDPDGNVQSIEEILRRLYGLTSAEVKLTAIILQGFTVREASQKLGVTIPTIRSHLQNIFQKTGTTRQSDLVRLLLTGPPASKMD